MEIIEFIALYTLGALSGAGLLIAVTVEWIRKSGREIARREMEIYGTHHDSSATSATARATRASARNRSRNRASRGLGAGNRRRRAESARDSEHGRVDPPHIAVAVGSDTNTTGN